jgi:DNA invertase Pin-like site-specific DNA recombinase
VQSSRFISHHHNAIDSRDFGELLEVSSEWRKAFEAKGWTSDRCGYARKSTEQNGVADEQKSAARQIEHARQYATRKGWTVADDHVYVDDGISGAEFANRPGFLRLMNALKPRAPFHVLVMSEESRLGREAIETAYALKQLVRAGVRVFFYLEDRERTLDSPTDKIMLSLTAFADELEREKARQRTYDAMQRKAFNALLERLQAAQGGSTVLSASCASPMPDASLTLIWEAWSAGCAPSSRTGGASYIATSPRAGQYCEHF